MWRLGEGPVVQGQIWGSFGKVIGDINIGGVRGLGPEIGNIDTGGSVWGRGYGQIQVIGYVNIVVPGEGLEP